MQKHIRILALALLFGLCLHSCLAETAGDEWRPSMKELLRLGVEETDERGMEIPQRFQFDYSEIVCRVDGVDRSVATSGCGATSVSMVIEYLTGNTEQNPLQLFSTSVKSGRYKGFGWSHETLAHYAHAYGVQTQWFSGDEAQIREYLNAGKPVIAHMGPGVFTDVGHFIVLRGVTESGKILINDPNSRENCALAFPLSLILSQTKGEDPFMACWVNQ